MVNTEAMGAKTNSWGPSLHPRRGGEVFAAVLEIRRARSQLLRLHGQLAVEPAQLGDTLVQLPQLPRAPWLDPGYTMGVPNFVVMKYFDEASFIEFYVFLFLFGMKYLEVGTN